MSTEVKLREDEKNEIEAIQTRIQRELEERKLEMLEVGYESEKKSGL